MEIETVLISSNVGSLYLQLLEKLLIRGKETYIGRTNVQTKEAIGMQLRLSDLRSNVFYHPLRKINYRFMLAEWLWILAGQDDLETLIKYNSRYEEYSDDGIKLAGAYGPRLYFQWDYVLNTLGKDPTSRQAVASIWLPVPQKSADIPCTLSCQFLIREEKLHAIFTMRSSDAWLGIPYDVFSFTQLASGVAAELGIETGSFILNLGSSHLYEKDWEPAEKLLKEAPLMESYQSKSLPCLLSNSVSDTLKNLVVSPRAPWDGYQAALHSGTSQECLRLLREKELLIHGAQ